MGYGIAIEEAGEAELYRFGRSKQVFRGPKPSLANPYFSFIGGSEPFGKFVMEPFPRLVESKIGRTCVNFGSPGAGPGFFLKDPVLLEACSDSIACVVQVMSAAQLSNRMYSVFPRRNMRLRGVSDTLKSLYPKIDFSGFRYVSSMLRKLQVDDADAYQVVLTEQRSAWLARMLELLEDIEAPKLLLWLDVRGGDEMTKTVTPEMVEILAKHADRLLKIAIPEQQEKDSRFGVLKKDTGWMTREVHAQVAIKVSEALIEMQDLQGSATEPSLVIS